MLKVLPGVGLTRGISTNSLVAHPSNDASCLRCHCGSSSSSDLHQLQLGIGPRTRGLVMPVSRGTSSLANHRDSRNPRPQLPAIPARSFPRHRRVIHPLPTDFIPDTCARGHPVLVPLRGTPGTRAHRAPPPSETTESGPPGHAWALCSTGLDTGRWPRTGLGPVLRFHGLRRVSGLVGQCWVVVLVCPRGSLVLTRSHGYM